MAHEAQYPLTHTLGATADGSPSVTLDVTSGFWLLDPIAPVATPATKAKVWVPGTRYGLEGLCRLFVGASDDTNWMRPGHPITPPRTVLIIDRTDGASSFVDGDITAEYEVPAVLSDLNDAYIDALWSGGQSGLDNHVLAHSVVIESATAAGGALLQPEWYPATPSPLGYEGGRFFLALLGRAPQGGATFSTDGSNVVTAAEFQQYFTFIENSTFGGMSTDKVTFAAPPGYSVFQDDVYHYSSGGVEFASGIVVYRNDHLIAGDTVPVEAHAAGFEIYAVRIYAQEDTDVSTAKGDGSGNHTQTIDVAAMWGTIAAPTGVDFAVVGLGGTWPAFNNVAAADLVAAVLADAIPILDS
jgi:hypothetical protein